MFLRSVSAFQFLPPRQLLNLLSEAIPKASLEDINSPSPSHSADGSPSLETFLGTALRSGVQFTCYAWRPPPATCPRADTGAPPGSSPSQETSALSPRASSPAGIWLEPAGLLSVGSWDVATLFFQKKRVCPCGCQHGRASWQEDQRMDGSLLRSLVQA